MSRHIDTRRKLRKISDVASFDEILNTVILNENERRLMELHYKDGKDLSYIADLLGYSESTIKHWHREILRKISDVIS